MARFINLFTDFGFKRIFGSEENKDILIDFLNTLLIDSQTIVSLHFLNTERLGNNITDRKAIYDLYCENDKGEKFIVELQRAKQEFFKERSIFYASRAIEEQSEQGKWNYNLKAVYTIAIMDFEFSGMGHRNVKSDVMLYDFENQMKFSDKLRFIYLEMPKFHKTEDELESNYDKWLYLLKNIGQLEEIPKRLQEFLFKKIFKLAEVSNYSLKDRKQYEESLKEYRDYYNTIDTAKKEAKEEGFSEGMKEGMERRNIEIIRNAILQGLDNETIAQITGLSLEEIQQVRR
jgi:predicted transposase/invertase (TIGR01784 family)